MRRKTKGKHGGRRQGAGRPLAVRGMLSRGMFSYREVYVLETIVVKMFSHGQMRRVRKTRAGLALYRLDEIASGNYRSYRYALDRLKKLDSTTNGKAYAGMLFRICKDLEKRDPGYRAILNRIIPKRTPTPFRGMVPNRNLYELKKAAEEIQRKPLSERLKEIRTNQSLIEQRRQREQRVARLQSNISQETFNKIKAKRSGTSGPFDYQYRRRPS